MFTVWTPVRISGVPSPYPRNKAEEEAIGAVLDWILDGRPLTTPFERALHEPKHAFSN